MGFGVFFLIFFLFCLIVSQTLRHFLWFCPKPTTVKYGNAKYEIGSVRCGIWDGQLLAVMLTHRSVTSQHRCAGALLSSARCSTKTSVSHAPNLPSHYKLAFRRIFCFSSPQSCPAEDAAGATPGKWGSPPDTQGLCKVGCIHGSMQNEEERLLNIAIAPTLG